MKEFDIIKYYFRTEGTRTSKRIYDLLTNPDPMAELGGGKLIVVTIDENGDVIDSIDSLSLSELKTLKPRLVVSHLPYTEPSYGFMDFVTIYQSKIFEKVAEKLGAKATVKLDESTGIGLGTLYVEYEDYKAYSDLKMIDNVILMTVLEALKYEGNIKESGYKLDITETPMKSIVRYFEEDEDRLNKLVDLIVKTQSDRKTAELAMKNNGSF